MGGARSSSGRPFKSDVAAILQSLAKAIGSGVDEQQQSRGSRQVGFFSCIETTQGSQGSLLYPAAPTRAADKVWAEPEAVGRLNQVQLPFYSH